MPFCRAPKCISTAPTIALPSSSRIIFTLCSRRTPKVCLQCAPCESAPEGRICVSDLISVTQVALPASIHCHLTTHTSTHACVLYPLPCFCAHVQERFASPATRTCGLALSLQSWRPHVACSVISACTQAVTQMWMGGPAAVERGPLGGQRHRLHPGALAIWAGRPRLPGGGARRYCQRGGHSGYH